MTTRSRILLAVHRLLLLSAATPLIRVWGLAYRAAARVWAAFLAYGERDSSAYVRGSLGADDALPGLSDVDVAVVLAKDRRGPGIARERATARWMRLRRAFPLTDLLLDYPLIFEGDELSDVAGTSTLTYGGAAYFGDGVSQDKIRMLERPGLYGATTDWRLLSGRERRPREAPRDAQLHRIAAWLELVYWWQWVFPACADGGPRTASLCVKLVTEPARIWLWLAHGERASGRPDVLRRALERLPEEEEGLRRALDLQRRLPNSPEPPLDEVLQLLLRLSARIARVIAEGVEGKGSTEVRLAGADPVELIVPQGSTRPGQLPLCDWKALTFPLRLPDERFELSPADPADPAALAAATVADDVGPYSAFRTDGVMIFPGTRSKSELRAVKSAVTDPVSFALADGRATAAFPEVAGWSAVDSARRAVAEHRAWLRSGSPPAQGGLTMLMTAARAALFLESISEGAPELALTVTETARRLADRSTGARTVAEDCLERYRELAIERTPPPETTLAAVRSLVESLPGLSVI